MLKYIFLIQLYVTKKASLSQLDSVSTKKLESVERDLSDAELFTGWWTEGSTPFRRKRREATIKKIVYLSQKVTGHSWSGGTTKSRSRVTIAFSEKKRTKISTSTAALRRPGCSTWKLSSLERTSPHCTREGYTKR